jgi:hypothetical protein
VIFCLDAVEPGAVIEKCPFWICGVDDGRMLSYVCMIVRGCCGICIGFVNVHFGDLGGMIYRRDWRCKYLYCVNL